MLDPLWKAFVNTAEQGSFTKAAGTMFLSPTAVMKQMNQLEQETGLKLFRRTSHGVQLTAAGRSLYEDAKRMEEFSREAMERALAARGRESHVIRLGTSPLYPCKKLMELWNRAAGEYPGFHLRMVPFQGTEPNLAENGLGKRFDVVEGPFDSVSNQKRFRLLKMSEDHFCLAMPSAHRLAAQKALSLEDLHGERLLMMPPGHSPANDAVRREIEEGHPQVILEDIPAYYDVDVFNTCAEKGCLLLTLEGWEEVHPALVTVPLTVPYAVSHGIISLLEVNEDTNLFLEIIRKNLVPL